MTSSQTRGGESHDLPQRDMVERRDGSTLINRNVIVERRRTNLRLEPAIWDAMAEICRREEVSLHDLCTLIDRRRRASSLTAAIRVFIVTYFRAAATEEGHTSIRGGPYQHRAWHALSSDAHRRPARRLGGTGVLSGNFAWCDGIRLGAQSFPAGGFGGVA